MAAVVASGCVWIGAAPAQAASTTYCVQKPSCVGTDRVGVQGALDSAELTPDADRVEVGPGTFVNSDPYHYAGSATNTVTLVGAGAGQTRLAITQSGNVTTLTLGHGTLSDLEIVGPQGGDPAVSPTALDLGGLAERVKVTDGFRGVVLRSGATLRNSVVTGSGLDYDRPGILLKGTSGSVLDCTVNTHSAGVVASSSGHLDISRSTIYAGAAVAASDGGQIDIDDSLVSGPASFTGLSAIAFSKSSTLVATNVTVVGTDPSAGTGVNAYAGSAGKVAVVTVQNSIISGVHQSLLRKSAMGLSYIKADHSAYDPSTISGSGTGNTWEVGGNTSAAPGFVDPAGGDYRLAPGSALIDAGSDALATGLPAKDLNGAARSVDGNGDSKAVPDIGAYEFVPAPPAPAPAPVPETPPASSEPVPDPVTPTPTTAPPPVLSGVSFSRRRFAATGGRSPRLASTSRKRWVGSRLRFTLSKDAGVRAALRRMRRGGSAKFAGAVRFAGHAGKNSVAFNGRVGRRALKPGRYVALVVATDADGRRSAQRRVTFRIVRHA